MNLSIPHSELAEFLATRQGWLELVVVPGRHGGWDVALRLDGAYRTRASAEEIRDYFEEVLVREFGGVLAGEDDL
jgi:hypothetical protein